MKTHFIKKGTLVILVGPAGSGKSTFCLKNFQADMVVSSDQLRESILGLRPWAPGANYCQRRAEDNNGVFPIMEQMVKMRLLAGKTTIVDSTNLSQGDRTYWVKLANALDCEHLVVFFDEPLETLLARNQERAMRLDPEIVKGHFNSYDKTCPDPIKKANSTDTFIQQENILPHNRFDVVGDIHGLLDEFKVLLQKMGWNTDTWEHNKDPDRMILLLGDIVDRGPYSVELLDLVQDLIAKKKLLMVCGNHEKKLSKFIQAAFSKSVGNWGSYSNAETGCALFRKKTNEELNAICSFIRSLPWYFVSQDNSCAFVHGDIKQFDLDILAADAIYGESVYGEPSTCDENYQWSFDNGLSKHTLFRGHIPQEGSYNNVFSLEQHAFDKGYLIGFPLDKLLNHSLWGTSEQAKAFQDVVVKHKCEFEFTAKHSLFQYSALRAMRKLAKEKLVFSVEDSTGLLNVYKYSKQVFYDNKWSSSDWLLKARGLVLDKGGTIVSHPFDKCYNYLIEHDTGKDVPEDEQVYAVEKLNGFLGIVSFNPFNQKLLVHTQGSFEGEHVDLIVKNMPKQMVREVYKLFQTQQVTLMFEVIDQTDPHIIEYDPKDCGLYLIGVRGLNLEDMPWPEEAVDALAKQIGAKRPTWKVTSFKQAVEEAKASKQEGLMIRRVKDHSFICKVKSAHYLSTKFIARLSDKKIKHMYKSPADFKKFVDEEFYALIDSLIKSVSEKELMSMPEQDRLELIKQLV